MNRTKRNPLDALYKLSPDVSREEWVVIAMAAKEAGVSFEEFDAWSSGGKSYNPRAVADLWRSIKPGQGIGAGTLYYMAADKRKDCRGHATSIQSSDVVPEESDQTDAPDQVWARCHPVDSTHPYVKRKRAEGVPLGQLRVVPIGDPLRISGELMDGALVVPVMRRDGTISSLQFITVGATEKRLKRRNKPSKLNLPGFRLEGWFEVGEAAVSGTIYVCEGIGAAWTSYRATGSTSVCCFGYGRMKAVATELREIHKSSRIVLVPDVGKEKGAYDVASQIGGLVAVMPAGLQSNADIFDVEEGEGIEAVERLLESASAVDLPPHPLASFLPLDGEIRPPRWVIPGFIAEGLVLIAGEPAVGKTSAIVPLSLIVTHVCEPQNPLRPRHWRHVSKRPVKSS